MLGERKTDTSVSQFDQKMVGKLGQQNTDSINQEGGLCTSVANYSNSIKSQDVLPLKGLRITTQSIGKMSDTNFNFNIQNSKTLSLGASCMNQTDSIGGLGFLQQTWKEQSKVSLEQ